MASKIITVNFTNSGTPQSGLTPTINIFELDVNDPLSNPAVVTNGPTVEIGLGWYRYDFVTYDPEKNYVFTFDGGQTLSSYDRYKYGGNESYVEEIAPAVWDEPTTDHLEAGSTGETLAQTKADTASILISEMQLAVLINTLLKYDRNRTRIDLNAAQMIIYDDDGVTPLTVFNLLDFNGMPNVQEVCEKIPVVNP